MSVDVWKFLSVETMQMARERGEEGNQERAKQGARWGWEGGERVKGRQYL